MARLARRDHGVGRAAGALGARPGRVEPEAQRHADRVGRARAAARRRCRHRRSSRRRPGPATAPRGRPARSRSRARPPRASRPGRLRPRAGSARRGRGRARRVGLDDPLAVDEQADGGVVLAAGGVADQLDARACAQASVTTRAQAAPSHELEPVAPWIVRRGSARRRGSRPDRPRSPADVRGLETGASSCRVRLGGEASAGCAFTAGTNGSANSDVQLVAPARNQQPPRARQQRRLARARRARARPRRTRAPRPRSRAAQPPGHDRGRRSSPRVGQSDGRPSYAACGFAPIDDRGVNPVGSRHELPGGRGSTRR